MFFPILSGKKFCFKKLEVGRKLADEENVRFQMVQKGQNNDTFMAKYFYQHFQIFSIFIFNETLPMKSYQFFKICKCFDKEREKMLMQQSVRKGKLRKVGLYLFYKVFNMIIKSTLMQI